MNELTTFAREITPKLFRFCYCLSHQHVVSPCSLFCHKEKQRSKGKQKMSKKKRQESKARAEEVSSKAESIEEEITEEAEGEVNGKKTIEDRDDSDTNEEMEVEKPTTKKRKMEMSVKEPSPKKLKGKSKKLLVRNLGFGTDDRALKNAFSGCKLAKVPIFLDTGKKREIGFVEYNTAEEAAKALELMNGQSIGGRQISVEYSIANSKKSSDKSLSSSSNPSRKESTLVVKNLGPGTDEDILRDAFEGCIAARVPTFSDTGRKKGFGFVEFKTKEEAVAAKESMSDQIIGGKEITIEFDGVKVSQVLFVKNLSFETDEQDLQDAFEGCLSVSLPVWPDTGRRKGFAFVRYRTKDEASKAKDSMSGQSIDGRQIVVDYSQEASTNRGFVQDQGWPFVRSHQRGGRIKR